MTVQLGRHHGHVRSSQRKISRGIATCLRVLSGGQSLEGEVRLSLQQGCTSMATLSTAERDSKSVGPLLPKRGEVLDGQGAPGPAVGIRHVKNWHS